MRGELCNVGLLQGWVVPTVLDPRRKTQLVDELPELRRSRLHHPQVLAGRLRHVHPRQRPREAVDRGERRPEVVARERDEPRKAVVLAQTGW